MPEELTVMRKKYRIISLFMAMLMFLSSMRFIGFLIPAAAEDGPVEDLTVRDDALHFIIRHWHTDYDTDAQHQGEAQREGDDWFVVVEGYILPPEGNPVVIPDGVDPDDLDPNDYDPEQLYTILLVNRDTGELVKVSELQKNEETRTPYLGKFNKITGSLELPVKPLRENNPLYDKSNPNSSQPEYDNLEKFCGISLSAGRGAVKFNHELDANGDPIGQTTGITIQYSKYVHIVKGHVFYSSWNKTVPGTSDAAVFDPEVHPDFEEIDTAEVYTWLDNGEFEGVAHKAGDIVKNGDDACWNADDLEAAGVNESEVKLTKFYSTNEGLHTNKTLVQEGDSGRLFLVDLEAWYVEGYSANIGFVLDASGSMAFVSDPPNKVNVYSALANRLDIKQDEKTGIYTYKSKSDDRRKYESHSGEELGDFIVRLAEDEGLLDEFLDVISEKIDCPFTETHWYTLFDLIGKVNRLDELESKQETVYVYPQHDKLIGYYEIQDNKPADNGTSRTWFLNSIKTPDSDGNIYRNPADYAKNYGSANDDDFGKMVWNEDENGNFNFGIWQTILDCTKIYKQNSNEKYTGWGAPFPLNFNNSAYSNTTHRSYGMNLRYAAAGVLLNVTPTGNNFTLSFTLENTYDTPESFNETIEILYVGKESGNKNEGGYFRVTREGGDLVFYNGDVELGRIGGVFGTAHNSLITDRQRFTFVFNGDDVGIYLGSSRQTSVKVNGLSGGKTIVFSPFNDMPYGTGNQDPLCYLDDIFLYDIDLDKDEVSQFVAAYNKGYKDGKASNIDDNETKTTSAWDQVFVLNTTVLSVLLNHRNTAHVPLGVAAYNYFVYDANATTREYAPLAYWDGTTKNFNGVTAAMAGGVNGSVIGKPSQYTAGNAAGWYYLTHGGNATTISDISKIKTAKILYGLADDAVKDYADLPGFERGATGNKDPETGKSYDSDGTGKEYKSPGDISIRFYIDANGNLRCFFSRSVKSNNTDDVGCSYVYELEDSQYVKTEALQRVLANFSTKLSERSPSSKISAVKFSTDNFISNSSTGEGLEQLVLLDWTSDSEQIAGIMSQKRGDGDEEGTALGVDICAHGIKQYNYFLTGSTLVYTGLWAYQKVLDNSPSLDDLNADMSPKYLVIFTDGADNDIYATKENADKNAPGNYITVESGDKTIYINKRSLEAADALKSEGYTIITVYLPCGPAVNADGSMNEDSEEYQKAKTFLSLLGGTSAGNDGENYFFASTDVTTLTNIFEDEILAQITEKMEDYTVKDYIDPRFDLQNADGTVWKLNADGKVVKVIKKGDDIIKEPIDVTEVDPETGEYYVFRLYGETTPSARDPYLRYDADRDMYYLEWLYQTIPSTPIGSNSLLPVWNAEFLLRAKDDFLGGNAVLTNGNKEKMNWVYHPADSDDPAEREAYNTKLAEEFGEKFDLLTTQQKNTLVREYAAELGISGRTWAALSPENKALVKSTYISKSIVEALKKSPHDASSGTDDMCKLYEKNEDGTNDYKRPIDQYPSKGFPRTTANVRLLPIVTNPIHDVMYMGETIAPIQLLTEIKDEYITDSYYLEYLKRYAYQRYLYNLEQAKKGGTLDPGVVDDMNKPILVLLTDWLRINKDDPEKEFSIPYMYLPHVEYDEDGTVFLNSDYEAKTIHNNTGDKYTNEKDVVGILTYRWEQLEPKDPTAEEPVKNFVKTDTERVQYSLTVEFTPLKVGDTLSILNGEADFNEHRNGDIFASYIPIEGSATNGVKFDETDLFDREVYVNGPENGKISSYALIPNTYALIDDDYYKWNRNNKPEVADEQLNGEKDPGDNEYPYGDATFMNEGRTLTAFSRYTIDVVSGGIALEFKVLIGELRKALEDGEFKKKFELTAARSFTDTDYVEAIKEAAGNDWEDYDSKFKFTFEFDYDEEAIEALERDAEGYVRIYAIATKAETKFGKNNIEITDLPIGAYVFSWDSIEAIQKSLSNSFKFATTEHEANDERFDTEYFNDLMLNGLNSTNEADGTKWRQMVDEKGNPVYDNEGNPVYEATDAEINNDNLTNFLAGAGSVASSNGSQTVTFYIGTMMPLENPSEEYEYVPKRGAATEYGTYTDSRLGIILFSTGMSKLIVREKGAQENENFFYRVVGKTLGDLAVDIVISVAGEGETAIEMFPGEYTVTEISDWSWRYYNEKTYGDADDYAEDDEDQWVIDETTWKVAFDPDLESRDTHGVTFVHARNEKVWVGGEANANNKFAGVEPGSSDSSD